MMVANLLKVENLSIQRISIKLVDYITCVSSSTPALAASPKKLGKLNAINF
jgi:hypothetical protein